MAILVVPEQEEGFVVPDDAPRARLRSDQPASARNIALALIGAVLASATWLFVLPVVGPEFPPHVVALVQVLFVALLQIGVICSLTWAASTVRGRARVAWSGLTVGCVLMTASNLVFVAQAARTADVDRSGILVVLQVAGIALTIISVLTLPPTTRRSRRLRKVDVAILAVTGVAIIWALPPEGTASRTEAALLELGGIAVILIAVTTLVRCRPDHNGEVPLIVSSVSTLGMWAMLHDPQNPGYATSTRFASLVAVVAMVLAIAAGVRLATARQVAQRRAHPHRHLLAIPEVATAVTLGVLAASTDHHQPVVPTLLIAAAALALMTTRLLQLDTEQRRLTVSLRKSADRLYLEARSDTLTGLGNRLALDEHLDRLLTERVPASSPTSDGSIGHQPSVLFIDIDAFKRINDALGHPVGDALLVQVAARIRAISGRHRVYRQGGDEFIIVTDGLSDGQVDGFAEELLAAFTRPVTADSHELTVGISIGLAAPDPSSAQPDLLEPSDLLARADLALYRSKATGGGRCTRFSPALLAQSHQQLRARQSLQEALRAADLDADHEPLYDLGDGEIVGVTTRLHWDSPELGRLDEGSLRAIAAEAGLLPEMLSESLRCIEQLADGVSPSRQALPVWVEISLSFEQLMHPGVQERLTDHLLHSSTSVPLRLLVTEDVIANEASLPVIGGLLAAGTEFTVDRFGTGPSSLFRMDDYPAAGVRLDESFVHGLGRRRNETAAATAVANLGSHLGLDLSAEGVDETFQRDFLLRLGFTRGRGRLYRQQYSTDELVAALRHSGDRADSETT